MITFSITKELIVEEDRVHISLYLIRKQKENTVSGHKSNLRKYSFCSNKEKFYSCMLHEKQDYQYNMAVQLSDLLKA